jgi:hypothetical protein
MKETSEITLCLSRIKQGLKVRTSNMSVIHPWPRRNRCKCRSSRNSSHSVANLLDTVIRSNPREQPVEVSSRVLGLLSQARSLGLRHITPMVERECKCRRSKTSMGLINKVNTLPTNKINMLLTHRTNILPPNATSLRQARKVNSNPISRANFLTVHQANILLASKTRILMPLHHIHKIHRQSIPMRNCPNCLRSGTCLCRQQNNRIGTMTWELALMATTSATTADQEQQTS